MLKRNKKIIAILTVTMITGLVNSGVAFADTKEDQVVQSTAVEDCGSSSSIASTSGTTGEVNKDVNTESKLEDNTAKSKLEDSTAEKVISTNVGTSSGVTGASDQIDVKSSDATSSTVNVTVGESKIDENTASNSQGITIKIDNSNSPTDIKVVEVAANAKVDKKLNFEANNLLQTSKLSADTKEVKANDSITLDIGGSNITITIGSGGSISVTGKRKDGIKIDGKEMSANTKIVITGGSNESSFDKKININPNCMPTIIIDNAIIFNGIKGGNITVKSGIINGDVRGGDSKSTEAGNVIIESGTINGNVYAGSTFNGTAGTVTIKDGTVNIKHGPVECGVFGGRSIETAGGNVIIEGGKINSPIFGGNSKNGEGGSIIVNGGEIKSGILAGESHGDNSKAGGSIIINGGTVAGGIMGGRTDNGIGGKVIITGGKVKANYNQWISEAVRGGDSCNGTGGDIIIEGGTIEGGIQGGITETGIGGAVIITGGTVKGIDPMLPAIVLGGRSNSGNAGAVTIDGGTIEGIVSGGETRNGTAGAVTLIKGEVGNIIGGISYRGKKSGTVTIKGGKVDGFVVGGIAYNGANADFDGNSLILKGAADIQGAVNIEGGTVGGMVLSGVTLDKETGKLTMNLKSGVLTIEGGKSTGNAVMVNGGSIRQIIINNPVNGDESNVYKNTVKLPIDKDEEVTCSVDNGNSTWKATTLDNGYLYMYLPESKENEIHQVRVTDSKGHVYFYNVSTKADGSSIAVRVIEKISVKEQPAQITKVTEGKISATLKVGANISFGETISYQWYSNSTNSNQGGTIINGATNSVFTIPTNLQVGEKYYYCVVNVDGCESVISDVAKVVVDKASINKDSSSEHKDVIAKLSDAKREVIGTLEKLTIDIKDKNIIDKEVLDYLRGNPNRQLVLEGLKYSWIINGQDVANSKIAENFDARAMINYEGNGAIRVKVNKAIGKIILKELNENIQSLNLYGVGENNLKKLLISNLKVSSKEVAFDLINYKEYSLSVN